MAGYSSGQQHIINALRQRASVKLAGVPAHVRDVILKAAFETGRVESNYGNPKGGDADSAGWRQERASLYPNPTNVNAAADRFYSEALKAYRPGIKSGELAALVQRPAAQYRGRYAGVSKEAQALLRGGGSPSTQGSGYGRTTTTTTPGVDNSAARGAAVLSYLQAPKKPNAIVNLASQVQGLQDTPAKTTTSYGPSGSVGAPPAVGTLAKVVERASRISAHARPYHWGGGHQKAGGSLAQAFDCSGAVSRTLGINPKVASQFKSFGQAGRGKHVTIYAKNDHVIMSINGHFFGTSQANPGGGAGWIPMSALSKAYLAQFTVRHPVGL